MALTADRNTPRQQTQMLAIAVGAGVRIFAGAQMAVSATGFAIPGKTATGLKYAGRAEESVDNSTGADGAKTVLISRGSAFKWANDGSVTQAQMFKTAYIVDDATVSATDGGGTRSASGLIVGIDSDGVWVE
ncbi:hypothetical protein LOY64_07115 [Pseudomonas corrugata]|uniref:hypothetical protein n=1 Tax=Pseudomonas corrugata TaxID=47879 RepID=UPI001FC94492|nr:hypothetical protein [Pseudomonas corrugata]MDU9022163.1 hypothetical protein [Pseudomonas corrugata]UZD92746.1 hypothetical protein LOY64_15430 [Pseudomonas corrugata]UZD96768.1 hypothetical protein LOY64_07115 [Pseudomonas corrugata]